LAADHLVDGRPKVRDVVAISRRIAFLLVPLVLAAVGGCSTTVAGSGVLASGATIQPDLPTAPPSSGATPGGGSTTGPAPEPKPTPTPTPPRKRDPAAVARAVDIRASDLPGWRLIAGAPTGNDSLSWVILCGRDAGVGPGTLSGAATPDFSPNGSTNTSQIGTATGLFADDASARKYLSLFHDRAVGRCMAAEAARTWPDSFSGAVGDFTPVAMRAAGTDEAAGLSAFARSKDGRKVTIQFFAIRTGPIVTMLDTIWIGSANIPLLNAVAAHIGARQRTA
jgi:hypothetical protein